MELTVTAEQIIVLQNHRDQQQKTTIRQQGLAVSSHRGKRVLACYYNVDVQSSDSWRQAELKPGYSHQIPMSVLYEVWEAGLPASVVSTNRRGDNPVKIHDTCPDSLCFSSFPHCRSLNRSLIL
jgi:hypothetical protein